MKKIKAQNPIGTWEYSQLIGASVKINSTAVKSGLFGYDCDSVYTIEDISFRMNSWGTSQTCIKLEGLNRTFGWKDLEVVALKFCLWDSAICGLHTICGNTVCGHEFGANKGSEATTITESDWNGHEDGDVLT